LGKCPNIAEADQCLYKIFRLGTNTGNATKRLLLELENAYGCYTYTDTSEKSLDCARNILEPHVDNTVYKILDIDLETNVQGYIDASYDLVVTFSTPDNISQLGRTLKIIRNLLKPGGYFLSPQLLDANPLVSKVSLNHDMKDGKGHRRRDSMASPSSDAIWVQTLEECNFADAELSMEPVCNILPQRNVIVLQALDSRIQFLRSPLSSPKQGSGSSEVTLIRGTKSSTSVCCSGIVELLQAHSSRVSQLETISRLTENSLPFGGNVLVLQDYDQPLFENLDESTFKGLQKLFENSKNILWVTHGYKGNAPPARMLVGFMRSLILEMPHVRLQILDLASPDELDATLVTEHLIRLVVTGRWEDENYLTGILWSTEPEIAYEDNQYFIPRVKLNKLMNDRHNSARRLINLPTDPLTVPVAIVADSDSYFAEARSMDRPAQIAKTEVEITIRVTHSFLKAVRITRSGDFFLVLGIDIASDKQVIALSSTLCSTVKVSSKLVRACDLPLPKALLHYRVLFYSLVAQNILHSVDLGQSLLVLEPSRDLANRLAIFAAAQDIETIFWTTTDIPKPNEKGCVWKRVPMRASKRDLVAALPRGTLSQVISWGENPWATSLRDIIPDGVPIKALGSYMADCGATSVSLGTESEAALLLDRVQNWLAGTKATLELTNEKPTLLADLYTLRPAIDGFNILDWSTPSTIPTRLKPTDQQTLFHPGKVYWLVGLTSDLGLSLCQWMISRGATHIVLSSRNPSIDNRWLAHFKSLGAVVTVICCDITDYSSVQVTHDKIKASVGPIAGVCHGAMVLHDALLLDLDLAKVQKVLKPKVNGAINLDKVFQNERLDFFVMLSSIAAVTGNPGQTAYAAGNGFLSALVAQRRKRGEVASCVALGAILGCGYVTRGLTLAQQESLHKAGVMWTSEQDFHTAFAEAVVAGSPRSGSSGDFTTGVRVCYTDEKYKPKHASNPIFSHLLLQRDVAGSRSAANLPTTSVKGQLLVASTEEETAQILESWLSSKLRKALQMPTDATVIDKTAETLGIDSLIAVEVKSCLMKELNVAMPILTIIGGGTMREMVVRCIEILDSAMTPYKKPRTDRKTPVEEDIAMNLERNPQGLSKRTASRDNAEQALTERTKLTSTDRGTNYQQTISPGPLANATPTKAHTVEPFDNDSEEKKTAIEQTSSAEVGGVVHRARPITSNDASKGTSHLPQPSFGSTSSSKATPSCSGSEQTRSSHQPEAKNNIISIRRVPETAPKSRLAKIRGIFSKRLLMEGKKSRGLLKTPT
jgi:hybrid polyketide synthase/nonribosomal peptide synthetase ACE1